MSFREKITVYPVYNMDGYKFMNQIEAAIRFYDREPDVSVNVIPLSSKEYDSGRRQFKADMIIERIAEVRDLEKKGKTLGVTSIDISMPNMNFVFGVTNTVKKVAVLSTARLTVVSSELFASARTVEERVFKESAHEIGHLLGLTHCPESTCIMSFANTIKQVDDKLPILCSNCRGKLKGLR